MSDAAPPNGAEIRVRGLVQGVGFRPTVWRIARALELAGSVCNDGSGVLIRLWAEPARIDRFLERLRLECPPLARIDAIERRPLDGAPDGADFVIVASAATEVHTGVVPDAATCAACAAEIADPGDRRHRYPFTNCTHCGPRLSIVRRIPYDRANTSMAVFPMCERCAAEYASPEDRRFHAQPNACPECGPRTWLVGGDGAAIDPAALGARDPVEAASRLLAQGRILAVKGIGGFHLACDAADEAVVSELRRRKRRWQKPFALMARDLDVLRRFCQVSAAEAETLASPAAPVVLLDSGAREGLAGSVAPGQSALGCMLPYSPLHRLLLEDWGVPLVMTSGNTSDEPQCIDNDDARWRLAGLADAFLLHDRAIVNRVDDSVVRVMGGEVRPLRRARGYAPAPLPLPAGFARAPRVLALGGELKNTVCLLQDGQAVLSQHLGDLQEASTLREFERTIALYRELFQHRPEVIAIDAHPGYHPSQVGRRLAAEQGLALCEVQHHRAHIAAVLADNGHPVDGGPVLGVALDGSGYGDDGTIWGGEWLVGDYRRLERAACIRPFALPGGTRAILEPWRCLYAQITETLGWPGFEARYGATAAGSVLRDRPAEVLGRMIERGINSPRTSSCGRLFDAVAAALGICAERISYEGQAAIELETLARQGLLAAASPPAAEDGYAFGWIDGSGMVQVDPAPMWPALLGDLAGGRPRTEIALRFHLGLAAAVVSTCARIADERALGTVALSGGVLQNRTLLELLLQGLGERGLRVLTHRRVPSNDGGLALGQAVIGALAGR